MGANHQLIPINREPNKILSERDGAFRTEGNRGDLPNYYPNSYLLDRPDLYGIATSPFTFSMEDISYQLPDSLEQQYQHAQASYYSLTFDERERLHQNLAYALNSITKRVILERVLLHLNAISSLYAQAVRTELVRLRKDPLVI